MQRLVLILILALAPATVAVAQSRDLTLTEAELLVTRSNCEVLERAREQAPAES